MSESGSPGSQAPQPKKAATKTDINVTPLIDIVLVLLIVFIVMVPGLSKALPVVVPQVVTTTTATPPNPNTVVVTIDQNGKLFLQSDEIQVGELSEKLCPVVQLQPAGMRKVFLKIDEEQPYQYAVNVLDQIRRASDRAKNETRAKPEWGGMDGGDVKVAISLKKRV